MPQCGPAEMLVLVGLQSGLGADITEAVQPDKQRPGGDVHLGERRTMTGSPAEISPGCSLEGLMPRLKLQ